MDQRPKDTSRLGPQRENTSGSEQTADAPDFDALARLLTDERRRDIIHVLNLHGAQTFDELADRLRDPSVSDIEWAHERMAVNGALQWYLVKHGVVEWDGHGDEITPGPAFEHAYRMLHGLKDGYAEAETRSDGGGRRG